MVRTFLLFIINTLLLVALDLPTTIESSVVSIKDSGKISISKNVPSGMAGVVIHNYGKNLEAITHSLVSLDANIALVKNYIGLEHNNIPKIKTPITKADRVVFGNLYDNILLIAPNKRVYSKIIKLAPDRFWFHPDLYAYYFMENGEDRVTIKNLREFANRNLVGLVVIVARDRLRVLDPISGKYLRDIPMKLDIKVAKIPFYSRFDGLDSTFSKSSPDNLNRYFKMVEEIR